MKLKSCKAKSDIEKYVIFGVDIDVDELTHNDERVHIDERGVYISTISYYSRINKGDYLLLHTDGRIKRVLTEEEFNLLYDKQDN